jgi:hypothetical protein
MCDLVANRRFHLVLHLESAHRQADIALQKVCGHFGFKTLYKQSLEDHIRARHEKVREKSCNQCVYTTYHASALAAHVKVKHDGIRDHKCPVCDYVRHVDDEGTQGTR